MYQLFLERNNECYAYKNVFDGDKCAPSNTSPAMLPSVFT